MTDELSAPGWEGPAAELAALAMLDAMPKEITPSPDLLDGLRWTASLYRDTFEAACKHVARIGATWDGWRAPSVPDALAALCTTLQRGVDTMVVLECAPRLVATKTIKRHRDGTIEKIGFGKAKHFGWAQETVEGVHGIFAILQRLAKEPRKLVIRADPAEGIPANNVTRRIYDHADGPAHFKAANPGRRWICFDFDGIKPNFFLHEPPSDHDLIRAVKYARSLLPAEFHNAACVYRWSASAGLGDWTTISLHLWFWLSRPVACRSIRDWAEKDQIVDCAMFSPAQAHYTAAPIFDGMADPLDGKRLGMIEGAPEVFPPADWLDLPDYQAAELAQQEAMETARAKLPPVIVEIENARTIDDARKKWCLVALENVCGEIQSAGKGNRHPTAHKKAVAMGGLVASGYLDRDVAERHLIAAIQSVVEKERWDDEARSICEGITEGMARPRDLSHVGLVRAAIKRPPTDRPQRIEPPDLDADKPDDPPPPSLVPEATKEPERPSDVTTAPPQAPPPQPTQGDGLRDFCAGLEGKRIYVEDVVPKSPVVDHEVPNGYWMTRTATGAWKNARDAFVTTLIAHAPVLITARFTDVDHGNVLLMLAWRERGRWVRKAIARGDAMQKTKVVRLAEDSSFPVTSESAGALARYLGDYEAKNIAFIRGMRVASSFGWQRGGGGFVWGMSHIDMQGRIRQIDIEDESTWTDDGIAFRAVDEGDKQIAKALRAGGSFTNWREAVRRLSEFPRATVGVFMALCSPVLEIVGAPNFTMDWGFRTSSGKTTLLLVAASVWGQPRELIRSWSATKVWIERTLETLGSIPLFLDDTKRARFDEVITKTIYMVADGRGDGRGNTKRADAIREWRTVMLSTGEQPATSFDTSGGTRPRCLEITDPPFGGESDKTAAITQGAKLDVEENFGHAGPRFVAWLAQNKHRWPEWKTRYQGYVRGLASKGSGAESRIGESRAVLTMTFELASEALGLDLPDPVSETWESIAENVSDAAGELEAFRLIQGWFSANETHFRGTKNAREPNSGWKGAVVTMDDGERLVGFYEHDLKAFLERSGYRFAAILSGWRARKFLVCDQGHVKRRVTLNGKRVRMVCFSADRFVGRRKDVIDEFPGVPWAESRGDDESDVADGVGE